MNPSKITALNFIQKLLKSNGEVYLVGGNVRDHLLNIPHKDFDLLVRKIPYSSLTKLLKPFGNVSSVGKSFGIVKFRPKDMPDLEFDFSLPRVEKSTGVGHRDFEVDFNPDIPVKDDLARRDFTINAMAIDLGSGKIIDPFSGQFDLKKGTIRQVFKDTFVQDPLRLLRAIQFSARLEFPIESETLAAMKQHAKLIKTVSQDRIIEEIRKLFLANRPSKGFDLMRKTGILKIIFPFLENMIGVLQPMKKNEDVYQHTMKVLDATHSAGEMENPGSIDIMLSALLHDIGKPRTVRYDNNKERTTFYGHQIVSKRIAKKWLQEYRVTNIGAKPEKIITLIENHMFETKAFYTDRAIRRFINKVGKENIFDLIDLRIADKKGGNYPGSMKGILNLRKRIRDELNKKPPFGPKDLVLNGSDIMNLGFQEGPIIGKIQSFLVEKTLDDPELNTKEKLTKLIGENFNSGLSS